MRLKKCIYCKNPIPEITRQNIDEIIYYDNSIYHSKCFIELCQEKIKNGRSKKWGILFDNIENVKKNTYDHFEKEIIKSEICKFIQYNYNIRIIPTYIWNRLNAIFSGNFKGMTGGGIPPEHLLDMWKTKMTRLNKIADNNMIRGKTMMIQQRIIYDLSILVNKYDDYVKFLEKQKVLQIESPKNKDIKSEFLTKYVSYKNDEIQEEPVKDDISDLVDDIFNTQ